MRLRSITPIAVRLPLARPMAMSGVTLSEAENLIIRIEDDAGRIGWGEGASAPTMTGETLPGMFAAAQHMRRLLEGAEIESLDAFALRLKHLMYGNAGAKSAIDMAVHDLAAKRRGVSLLDLLGGAKRSRTPVLWMLASADLDADRRDATAKADEGIIAYKVKVGGKGDAGRVARDLERAAALRRALGPSMRISADANEGFSRDEGVAFAKGASSAGLDFIEQLVAGHDLDAMHAIVTATDVPVAADEGIHSIEDLERHHAKRAAHGGSLKVLKLGGVGVTMAAGARAAALGMRVNLAGKTAESGIASAAIAHIAAALPQIDWDVSVTNQYLAEDIVRNPVRVRDGHVVPPAGPGLGADVDEDRLARFAFAPLAA